MTIILAAVAWLLTYLLHSTVFLLGAAALAALGAVRSAEARDTLWKVAMVGGALTATAQTGLRLQPRMGHVALATEAKAPRVDIAQVRTVRPAPAESTPSGVAFASAIAQHQFADLPAPRPERSVRPVVSGLSIGWPTLLLGVWLLVAAVLCARLALTRLRLSRRLQGRRTLSDGALFDALAELARSAGVAAPRLSSCDRLRVPIAFSNEICVPERVAAQLSAAEQRAVLAHELGHIVRRDPAWLAFACTLENLCFLQPLNRLARRRLREVSEYLCDDWAARQAGGLVLASCLARVAEWMQGEPSVVGVAGMAGRCSELVSRVERLLAGSAPARPARLLIRALAGVVALAAVAWSVPGVAAEDVSDARLAPSPALEQLGYLAPVAQGQAWGEVRDDGRMIEFLPGFSARFTGQGRLGFRQYGRAIVLADGYRLIVAGRPVQGPVDLCESMGPFRIEGPSGGWDIEPMRVVGAPRYADSGRAEDFATATTRAALRAASAGIAAERAALAEAEAENDAATDAALGGEADAAIDTLVQLWVRDPEAVRRAAHRIARNYDQQLRPQFESLGVQLGRDLAPQLQRLTDHVGRDLAPEFARLGAALGATIVQSLDELPVSPSAPKHLKRPDKD
jgi:hypothetical protein